MPTKQKQDKQLAPISGPLSINEMTTLLIKHYGLHSGHYELMIEFKIGVGAIGSMPGETLPGAAVGVSKFGLVASPSNTPLSVDAAVVNPE